MTGHRAALIQFIFSILLLAACPLSAFAVDTDGDGVDDSVDAFPADPVATTDTDGDGKPDAFVRTSWFESFEAGVLPAGWAWQSCSASSMSIQSSGAANGTYYLQLGGTNNSSGSTYTCHMTKAISLPTATTLTYQFKGSANAGGSFKFYIDNVEARINPYTGVSSTWRTPLPYSLSAGVHTLKWTLTMSPRGGNILLYLDDFRMGTATALIEDDDDDNDGVADGSDAFPLNASESIDTDMDGTGNNADLDDDGDGVPDYIDAEPLNAANASEIVLPVDANYKGSQVRDGVGIP
jgi:hypothetical protein